MCEWKNVMSSQWSILDRNFVDKEISSRTSFERQSWELSLWEKTTIAFKGFCRNFFSFSESCASHWKAFDIQNCCNICCSIEIQDHKSTNKSSSCLKMFNGIFSRVIVKIIQCILKICIRKWFLRTVLEMAGKENYSWDLQMPAKQTWSISIRAIWFQQNFVLM